MNVSMTKESVLNRLSERLAAAEKEDARLLNQHKKDEEKALKDFKEKVMALAKEIQKWDYAKFKEKRYVAIEGNRPSCPRKNATSIAAMIKRVGLDERKAPYQISPKSDLWNCLNWMAESERPKTSLCEE